MDRYSEGWARDDGVAGIEMCATFAGKFAGACYQEIDQVVAQRVVVSLFYSSASSVGDLDARRPPG